MCRLCRPFSTVPAVGEGDDASLWGMVVHPVRHVVHTSPQVHRDDLKPGRWYIGYEVNRFPGVEACFVGQFVAERKRSRGYCKYGISPSTYTFHNCKVSCTGSGVMSLHGFVERAGIVKDLCKSWQVRARDITAESFFAEGRGVIAACSYCRFFELPVHGVMDVIREGVTLKTNGVASADIFASVAKYLGGDNYEGVLADRYVHAQFARVPGMKRVRGEK